MKSQLMWGIFHVNNNQHPAKKRRLKNIQTLQIYQMEIDRLIRIAMKINNMKH